jgi:transcriptional regulator with XRE-family HTH domain
LSIETVAGRIKRTGRDGKPTTLDSKYLQAIEQGYHSPTITTAVQIAAAMDVPLAELVADL